MPSDIKTCNHGDKPLRDWRECWACCSEVGTSLVIAKSYLNEIANGDFTDNGDMLHPIAEPLQGRHFKQIAATALGIIS